MGTKYNKQTDLLCTSRNGTNWTISREATRPVEFSSLSPLSASKIYTEVEDEVINYAEQLNL